jgi:hypothetical protein
LKTVIRYRFAPSETSVVLKSVRDVEGSTSTGIPPAMIGIFGRVTVIGAQAPVVGATPVVTTGAGGAAVVV